MFLGIDYGNKRIGLAIADSSTKLAVPFEIIENKNRKFVLVELNKIIEQENIDQIVVGVPYNMEGEETEQTKDVLEFIKFLNKNLDLQIHQFDERLSTKAAETLLGDVDKKSHKDAVAAMVILQDFLN